MPTSWAGSGAHDVGCSFRRSTSGPRVCGLLALSMLRDGPRRFCLPTRSPRKQGAWGGVAAIVAAHGMAGFTPMQGHVASAVRYLAHALRALHAARVCRGVFVAGGSAFLGRMAQMSDGVSCLLDA